MVSESLQRAAARERVDLIMVNNRYSPKEALRNADTALVLTRGRLGAPLALRGLEPAGVEAWYRGAGAAEGAR